MKIVFLVHSLRGGGAERLLLELASSASSLGMSVTVISWLSVNDFNEEKFKNINIINLLEANKYRWPLSLFGSSKKLGNLLAEVKPDAVFLFSHTVTWLAALSRIQTSYINVIMGYSQVSKGKGWRLIVYKPIDVFISHFLKTRIIAPSETLGNAALKYLLIKKNRLTVIPNGIEHQVKKKERVRNNIFTITMLGTLSFHKGQHLALESLRQIINKGTIVCLKILGDGSIKSHLHDLIEKYSLPADSIKILGRRDDALEIVSNSDLFWHLSKSEGMPLAVIEAMSFQLPIVGFDVNGVRELVSNNQNGYLVQYADVEAIAEKTRILIDNEDLRNKMGKRSSSEFEAKYTKNQMLMSYKEFIRDLL